MVNSIIKICNTKLRLYIIVLYIMLIIIIPSNKYYIIILMLLIAVLLVLGNSGLWRGHSGKVWGMGQNRSSLPFSLGILFCFFFFCFWPPGNIQSSKARDQIWTAVATYVTAVAMLDHFNPLCWGGIEPVSWHTETLPIPLCHRENS